jgi:hypothetical protein
MSNRLAVTEELPAIAANRGLEFAQDVQCYLSSATSWSGDSEAVRTPVAVANGPGKEAVK